MSAVIREALLLVALGLGLGLLANAVRADGLSLGRDHFPQGQASAPKVGEASPAASVTAGTSGASGAVASSDSSAPTTPASGDAPPAVDDPTAPAVGTATDGVDADVAERLAAKGLKAVGHAAAEALWRDPMCQDYGATLFIDARRAEQFAEAHIPGAYAFDPFYPERTLDTLLPLLPTVQTLVVYCAGGHCDDSESAALFLLQFGADPNGLLVYAGGMTAWTAAGLPLEAGMRGSGRAPGSDG